MSENLPLKIVIFGGTGDLVRKKIIPAIFDLYKGGLLVEDFEILGVSRKDISDSEFQNFIKESLGNKNELEKIESFAKKGKYFSADISDNESFLKLVEFLNKEDELKGVVGNKIYYLAISPNLYEMAFNQIAQYGLIKKDGWSRLLVEKPFGNDFNHAEKLDKLLGELFSENQIFRIDHYLAKETLQNILTFRFANSIFEPIWNSDAIEEVRINMFESFDVDKRGVFYDGVGALRDVGQNHLLQMLALVTMEDPGSLNVEDIRSARADVLGRLEVDVRAPAARAQYLGYNEIPGINPETQTETFFSINAQINNKRWQGTNFRLTSGKALKETYTEISVIFKEKWTSVCPPDDKRNYQNIVTFKIQPKQEIKIQFWSKKSGFTYEVEPQELSFDYEKTDTRIPDAYEKVLYDCIKGDQTLFISTKEILAQWDFIEKIIESWKDIPVLKYNKGTDPYELF
ncbi:MAG: glucose-6-phosphate dehydrogenase [Candidatus Pacebacteria bacterium]|nr:glucose-6-phosphate dehydrogenase [Candidatus Paceibacterota bacterium]